MSITKNQFSEFWQDVLASLRCIPSVRNGLMLSNRDSETLSQAIISNALIITDCCACAPRRHLSNLKRWCIFVKKMRVEDLEKMIKEPLLNLRVWEEGSYESFKHSLSSRPSDIGAFFAPVSDYLVGFLTKPNAQDFTILNQFLSFLSRVTLQDVDFQTQCLENYYKDEKRLTDLELPDDLCNELQDILYEWLKPFTLGPIKPRHSQGGTAFLGRSSNYQKNKDLFITPRLKYLVKDDLTFFEYQPPMKEADILISEVVFVPKNMSTMRTICMEPTSLMYFQQAALSQIDLYMKSNATIRSRINIHDQSQNRQMSQKGSFDDSYATIDLSAASDSVSWDLVKRIFARTDYLKIAMLTRSERAALPDGNIIGLKKFAPMGSALCFPTQCLIFAAVCENVARQARDRRPHLYSIYGDDIVIRTEYGLLVKEHLQRLGFIINTDKSYFSGRFKESCGGEFFDGIDVTPLKIPRKFSASQLTNRTPELYALLIDYINKCNARNYVNLRNFLIRKFSHLPANLQPIFDDGRRGISTTEATNFHLQHRLNVKVQTLQVRHGSIRPECQHTRIEDSLSLLMWFIAADNRPSSKYAFKVPEDTIIVSTAREQIKVRSNWSSLDNEDDSVRLFFTLKSFKESTF